VTFPNLVIAGAPKCGTSSLFNWLVDHPDACGSSVKETFFLMDEDHPLRRANANIQDHGLEGYAGYFTGCGPERKVIVEATTHYMYQKTALDVLATLPTHPRILFLLRKPSERVHSSFAYSKSKGYVRDDLSFAEYLRLIRGNPGRRALESALGPSAFVLSHDLQFSRYVDYIVQWRDRIGAERIRILLFEQMRSDPRAFMRDLCVWLGLDPALYEGYDFAARNTTVAVRSRGLQRFARAASTLALGPVRDALKALYVTVQSKKASGEMSDSDRIALAELEEEFRPFNERLAGEFGLNLDAWN
jgi:hypothetical protein